MAGFTQDKGMGELAQRRAENKARAALGFSNDEPLFPAKIRKRFSEIVKRNHPDTAAEVVELAENSEPYPAPTLEVIVSAKGLLLSIYGEAT